MNPWQFPRSARRAGDSTGYVVRRVTFFGSVIGENRPNLATNSQSFIGFQ